MDEQTVRKSEDKIQQDCVMWFKNTYCLKHHKGGCMIAHVPNQNQHKLVKIGVYPGFSDLIMILFGKVYFLEVKTPKGIQSENQKKFQAHAFLCGVDYYIIRSLHEFQQLIQILLKLDA